MRQRSEVAIRIGIISFLPEGVAKGLWNFVLAPQLQPKNKFRDPPFAPALCKFWGENGEFSKLSQGCETLDMTSKGFGEMF